MPVPAGHFRYRTSRLHCEGLALAKIAATAGTPVYVYSQAAITENYRRLDSSLRGVPHTICYSVKANSNLTLLRTLARLGAGFDIVSGGELHRVLCAQGRPGKTVFSGVGKTSDEIDLAIRRRVMFINIESAAELEMLAERTQALRRTARVGVRVNPDVNPHTHRHISTGQETHKFGVDWRDAPAVCLRAAALPRIEFAGIGCHIGSQITALAPFEKALRRLEKLAGELARHGHRVQHLDCGGGLGIPYGGERTVALGGYARLLKKTARKLSCGIVLEPGRRIVGPAGVLLTRVILEKTSKRKRFVVVDAAMNDLIRPALYSATHRILPVVKSQGKRGSRADVVGPVCETADCFARQILLPNDLTGQLLAIMDAGAYGFSLASNYNSRPRPPEVLVRGSRFQIIRKREQFQDMIRGE